jgi:hypothetical protein
MAFPVPGTATRSDRFVRFIIAFLWAIIGVSVVLAISIALLPQQAFLAVSNYLQIIAGVSGALICLGIYHRNRRTAYLLLAAGAFILWTLSNIAWYVIVLLGHRTEVFPGPVDIGIIVSILIFAATFRLGFAPTWDGLMWRWGLFSLFLIVPAIAFLTLGPTGATGMILIYYLSCSHLVNSGLSHGLRSRPLILTGTLLFVIAFLIYPIREAFFLSSPLLSVIGTFVSAGFALITLGLLSLTLTRS